MKRENAKRNKAKYASIKPEIEGAAYNWFFVCGDCHGIVGYKKPICPHCGVRIRWEDCKRCIECEFCEMENDSGSEPHLRCSKAFRDIVFNDENGWEVMKWCPMIRK